MTMPALNINGEMKKEKPKKKRRGASAGVRKFAELYSRTGEILGEGSFGTVETYRNLVTSKEYAVKVIEKNGRKSRTKVLKEIEICYHCQGHPNILQIHEYFEEEERFYVILEKMEGGSLLKAIEKRCHLTEHEASHVIREVASALNFLHKKGIAHRDLKPENILCSMAGQLTPIMICDFDLGSGIHISSRRSTPITTPELQSPVGSAEFMAPEVVDVWQDLAWSYDKRCDLWSLGIIMYILLCGYAPFYGHCGRDCGWEDGGSCAVCQDMLFNCIKEGSYDFPDPEWTEVSSGAKDLIGHLLVKNPMMRYSADQVLQHPWITTKASQAPLATPSILHRSNSIRELQLFAENCNALNRMLQHHLSISQAFHPPTFCLDPGGPSTPDECSSGIATKASQAPLAIPSVLQRSNSIRELQLFAENANALNRMLKHHMSVSQAFRPPTFCLDPGGSSTPDECSSGIAFSVGVLDDNEENVFCMTDLDEFPDDNGTRESVGQ